MIQCSMDSEATEREAKKLSKVHKSFPVAMRLGETPVPIPNTMVKTQAADGTMLETAWESRWLPDSFKKTTLMSVLHRTDMFQWAEIKAKPVIKNVLTYFSRVVLFR